MGRETSCDLVLEHPTISRFHACIELAADGLVSIRDTDSSNGTFLKRNGAWIQVKKATLCIDDHIRFGEHEVPLEKLTAVFGSRSNARLEARHFSLRHAGKGAGSFAELLDSEPALLKPKRNPATGKIEEDRL
jgi:pSer/pThr/pTyr-binding forkhead associated (FHA) protein